MKMVANLSTQALTRLDPVEESGKTIGLDMRFTETLNVVAHTPQMALSDNLQGERRAEIDATALGKYLPVETLCTRHHPSVKDEVMKSFSLKD